MSAATYWRVQECPSRWLWRWRVVAFDRPGCPTVETFLTRGGAERFIRRNTWREVA